MHIQQGPGNQKSARGLSKPNVVAHREAVLKSRHMLVFWSVAVAACSATSSTSSPAAPSRSGAPSASAATYPLAAPIPGKVAYNNGDHALWVMAGDGSDARRLTSGSGNDFDPKW